MTLSYGQEARFPCEGLRDEQSDHKLEQLIVVSADRAVRGEFLHYAKALELSDQLAPCVFQRMPRSIYRHAIPEAITGVVEVTVFALPIHRINGHIDGGSGGRIARTVVDKQCGDISHHTKWRNK